MTLDSVGAYHTAPLPYGAEAIPAATPVKITGKGELVLGLFGHSGRVMAFMVVNRSYKQDVETLLDVVLPGNQLQELDRKTGKWIDVDHLGKDRTVKVRLGAGDGRLFRVAE